MSALTSLLARDGVVSMQAIEDALLQQVLEGGEIDTALLEGGALPENMLSAYRAATYGVAPATRERVMAPREEPVDMLSAELAERFRIMPMELHGDRLTVACKRPLAAVEIEGLTAAQPYAIEVLVAVEVRVEAALATHYGVEISGRMRHLASDLISVDPGPLLHVEPPPELETVHLDGEMLHAFDDDEDDDGDDEDDEDDDDGSPRAVVAVAPVVTLAVQAPPAEKLANAGAPAPEAARRVEPAQRAQAAQPAQSIDTAQPARPIQSTRPAAVRPHRPPRRSGPMTLAKAREELEHAHDRDAVVEIYFSYARQFFECTALLAIRGNRALGLEASGTLDVDDITTVSVEFAPGGAIATACTSAKSAVADLAKHKSDQLFVNAIGRTRMQPSGLIPIRLGKRVVSLLYGDRDGEHFVLDDLADLVPIVPDVVHAFERIIRERKLFAMQAARASTSSGSTAAPAVESTPPAASVTIPRPTPSVPPPDTGSTQQMQSSPPLSINSTQPFDAPSRPTPATGTRRQSSINDTRPLGAGTLGGAAERASLAPRRPAAAPTREALSKLGVPRSAPPPPVRHPSSSSIERNPTIKLPRSEDVSASIPPPSHGPRPSKPPPGTGAYRSLQPVATEELGVVPRTKSSPPPRREDGAYRVADRPSEIVQVDRANRSSSRPPPTTTTTARAKAPAPRASDPLAQTIDGRRSVPGGPPSAPRPHPTSRDARADGAPGTSAEVVNNIPQGLSDSLRPPAVPAIDPAQPSIIVDLGADLGRLVAELERCGPEDEAPAVESLLRLGEVALPALVERFPGPLWFDRRGAPKVLPSGRDISANARAFAAFGARAAPYIAELMSSRDADVRFYSTLLAADIAPSSLLHPFVDRAYDEDPQIRLMVRSSLPVFATVSEYKSAIATLRACVGDVEREVADRLNALEVLATIREPRSVDVLIDLTEDTERQLTVPAKRALVAITGHDFPSRRKWMSWIKQYRDQDRAEWLIEGLMHPEESVRAVAGSELQKLTRVYHGFVASASKRERERVQKRYRHWWRHQELAARSTAR